MLGSDGILLIQSSDVGDIRMRIFNPDGSEAEACGNGIPMFAKYDVVIGISVLGITIHLLLIREEYFDTALKISPCLR